MKIRTVVLLIASLAGANDDTALLSPEKAAILQYENRQYESEYEKLRTNWISPLNFSGIYSHDKGGASDIQSDTFKGAVSISQDIFRSGGIEYQIQYAEAKFDVQKLGISKEIATLNLQLFSALIAYRELQLKLSQSDLKLKNEDIAVFIKRQLYEAGKADITELNTVLMERSAELQNNTLLRHKIASQRYEITKISNLDPNAVTLPKFTLIERQTYLDNALELRYAHAQNRMYEEQYNVTRTDYLPSLSADASAGYIDYDPRKSIGGYNGEFYSAGLTLSIPFVYNASDTIEEARAVHLRQVADTADQTRQSDAAYRQSIETIEGYRKSIEITRSNIALYNELIVTTKAGFDAGTKTGYDLQTIQNTRSIEELNLEIYELNIQTELAKLHFAVNTKKEL